MKMGPTRCPETSVNNYHTTPCNYPKDHRLHQHRGGSLKSRLIMINVTERDKSKFGSPTEQPHGWYQVNLPVWKDSALDCVGTELHYCGLFSLANKRYMEVR
jgi:hypothetical protein